MSILKSSVVPLWLFNPWLSTTELLKLSVSISTDTGCYLYRLNQHWRLHDWNRSWWYLAVDKGQFEAATAFGMTHNQTMRKIVLPQVVRNILPATGNEFVINIKRYICIERYLCCRTLFLRKYVATQTYQYFQTFTIIAVIYFVLTFTVTRILRFIERYGHGYLYYRC